MTGFETGEEIKISLSTRNGIFYLNEPSQDYKDIFLILWQKCKVLKIVYSCLKNSEGNYTYEDLVEDVTKFALEDEFFHEFSEQDLLNCGKYVVEQIIDYEKQAEDFEETVLDILALKELAKNANVGLKILERKKRAQNRQNQKNYVGFNF